MSSKDLKPKTVKGVQTRDKLLRAAEYVFGEKGYHESSIVEITQTAEVSLGSFYTYFESKYHIFESLLWEMQKELLKSLSIAASKVEGRIEKERAGFKTLFEFVEKHPHWYSLFPQAEFVNKDLYRKALENFSKGYIDNISEAMENGELRKLNPIITVYSLMGIANYVGVKLLLWEKKNIDDELIDEVMDFIKYGISPNGREQD